MGNVTPARFTTERKEFCEVRSFTETNSQANIDFKSSRPEVAAIGIILNSTVTPVSSIFVEILKFYGTQVSILFQIPYFVGAWVGGICEILVIFGVI